MNRKLFMVLFIFIFVCALASCDRGENTTTNYTTESTTQTTTQTTEDITQTTIRQTTDNTTTENTTTDNTTTENTTTENTTTMTTTTENTTSMTTTQTTTISTTQTTTEVEMSELEEILDTLYHLVIDNHSFTGSFEAWLSETNVPTDDSQTISFQIDDEFLQWQYAGSDSWNNLIEVSSLTGIDELIEDYYINENNELIVVYQSESINIGEILINFTVIFVGSDQEILDAQSVEYGSDAQAPTPPAIVGYTFSQWSQSYTDVSRNVITVAEYVINDYTIAFDSNEGDFVEPITLPFGASTSEPGVPGRVGYSFGGWYKDLDLTIPYTFTVMPAENITLYAKWDINQYTIYFDENEGSMVTDITQDYHTQVSEPINPTRYGYDFVGWFKDSELTMPYTFDKMPAENITLYAKWLDILSTMSFTVNGGSSINDFIEEAGADISAPISPTREGYSFVGWYSDAFLTNAYTFDKMPSIDITLYAKWSPNLYTVNYVLNDQNASIETLSQYAGSSLFVPDEREGYSFVGWYSDDALTTPYTSATSPLSDTTLYAKWSVLQYTVNYAIAASSYDPLTDILLQPNETIVQVDLGSDFSGILTSKGRVFMCGLNTFGQLGNGTNNSVTTPVDITSFFSLDNDETIIDLELGADFAGALTSKGRVFTWGFNLGRLGNGSFDEKNIPQDITSGFNLVGQDMIISLTLGSDHSAVITSNGNVFMWGKNDSGQLADGTTSNRYTPVDVTTSFTLNTGETIEEVILGYNHSCARTSDDRVLMWGNNYYGQLGNNSSSNNTTPIDITSFFNLNSNESIVQVSLGSKYTMAVTSNGRVFTWGYRKNGILGDGVSNENGVLIPTEITSNFNLYYGETITYVSAGFTNSAAISSTGSVYIWGLNSYGQLGDGTKVYKYEPVNVTVHFNIELNESITQISFTNGSDDICTLALTTDSTMFGIGSNKYSQMGVASVNQLNIALMPYHITLEQANIASSILCDFNAIIQDDDPNYPGYAFDGWYVDASFTTAYTSTVMPSHDVTLYGKLSKITYQITYTYDEGNYDAIVKTYDVETESFDLEKPYQQGYRLDWYLNPTFTGIPMDTLETGTTGDLDLYGKWVLIDYHIYYTLNGGVNENNPETYTFETPTIVLEEPTRLGYTFLGWYKNNILFTEITLGSENNIYLVAKWDLVEYTITYHYESQTSFNPYVYYVTSEDIILEKPSSDSGYTFGWFDNPEYTGEPIEVIPAGSTGDITFYGKQVPIQYQITYVLQGASNESNPLTYDIETIVNLADAVKDGYHFDGWYENGAFTGTPLTEIPLGSSGDLTLYAKLTIETYPISYVLNAGENTTNPTSYTIHTTTLYLNDPTRVGYVFDGWYQAVDFSGSVVTEITSGSTGNITLYAKWFHEPYTIKYSIIDDGYGSSVDVLLEPAETISQVVVGEYHSALLTSNGRVLTWGLNDEGQLGNNTYIDSYEPIDITYRFDLAYGETITQIALGPNHSAAISSNGRLFVWGRNNAGQYGIGTSISSRVPIDVTTNFTLNSGEAIDKLVLGESITAVITSQGRLLMAGFFYIADSTEHFHYFPIDLTGYFNLNPSELITDLAFGDNFTAALTSTGRMFTWGYNFFGNLGDNTKTENHFPTDITANFNLDSGEVIEQISLGYHHGAALTSNGRLFTWGSNYFGQLGDSTVLVESLVPIEITNQFTLNSGEEIENLYVAYRTSIFVTSDNRIFMCGENLLGKTEAAGIVDRYTPVDVTAYFSLDASDHILMIAGYRDHSILITDTSNMFVWGKNDYGQLADATTTDRYNPIELCFYSPTLDSSITYYFNDSISAYAPTKTGYTFDGWYLDSACTIEFTALSMPAEDLILYGRWIEN